MKIDLRKENPDVKKAVLVELIPAFPEKEIVDMTNLPASTIGYYRRTYKIKTLIDKKREMKQDAEFVLNDTLEHDKEYAVERLGEICADYGIGHG